MIRRMPEIRLTREEWETLALRPQYFPVALNPTARPRALWLYRARQRRQNRREKASK